MVSVVGARQVGKTTLAEQVGARVPGPVTRFDLTDLTDLARLSQPDLALGSLRGLVILDGIQHRPDLCAVLRSLADRPEPPARFLVLGSAAVDGYACHRLDGFCVDEVGTDQAARLWLRGGLPRAFLADDDHSSQQWRRQNVTTLLERDLPRLGIRVPRQTLGRFWQMLAHCHGRTWNGAELARAFGVAESTVRRYLEVLLDAGVVWALPAWREDLPKRQVRSPRIYIRDSGLLHTMLNLTTRVDLMVHPKVGASWEGFVLQEVIRRLGAREDECFGWATYAGAALDLLVVRGNRRVGIEVKHTTVPRSTRALQAARASLGLADVVVVHAGDGSSWWIAEGVRAVAFARLAGELPGI